MDKPSDLETALILAIDALREMNQGQRQRFLIMDSQLRVLDEFAQRLENLETRFEAVLHDYKAHCRVCSRLNILCSNVGTNDKGPHDDEKDLNKKLSDWN